MWSFISCTGTLCLFGDEIDVDWLKPSIKQELHKSVPVLDAPGILPFSHIRRDAPSKGPVELADCHMLSAVGSVVDYLKLVCEKRQLGSPQFYTKCVQRNPEGWRLFWYQVTIPKCPSPFNGLIWIKPDHPRLEDHEKVKSTVALQLLQVLGKCSCTVLLWKPAFCVVQRQTSISEGRTECFTDWMFSKADQYFGTSQ